MSEIDISHNLDSEISIKFMKNTQNTKNAHGFLVIPHPRAVRIKSLVTGLISTSQEIFTKMI